MPEHNNHETYEVHLRQKSQKSVLMLLQSTYIEYSSLSSQHYTATEARADAAPQREARQEEPESPPVFAPILFGFRHFGLRYVLNALTDEMTITQRENRSSSP